MIRALFLLFSLSILAAGCRKPKPCVQPSSETANIGQEVSFLDCSEHAYNYEYDFGDGSAQVKEQAPKHTYTKPGTFTVTMNVTNKRGKKEREAEVSIKVLGITSGDFTVHEWVLYKTAEFDDLGAYGEMNVQSPNHIYRFATDSVYINDGFSNPIGYRFEVLSDNQIIIRDLVFTVVKNHDNEIWYREAGFGFYTQYYLKKRI